MIRNYGIDTSVLLRLVTGDPDASFKDSVAALGRLVQQKNAVIAASNQVIGEAYIALQHHYGLTKQEARDDLATVMKCGLVAPLNGRAAMDALAASGGCGLLDRLIADDYLKAGCEVVTLDRKMAALPKVKRLV